MKCVADAAALLEQGAAQVEGGSVEEALATFMEAAELFSREGNELRCAGVYRVIGDLRASQENFELAAKAYKSCCDFLRAEAKKAPLGQLLNDRGLCLARSDSYEEALVVFKEALSIFQNLEDEENICAQLGNIGSVYRDLGDDEGALGAYRLALELRERRDDREGLADQLTNIAYIFGRMGREAQALELYDKAAVVYEESGVAKKAVFATENASRLRTLTGKETP